MQNALDWSYGQEVRDQDGYVFDWLFLQTNMTEAVENRDKKMGGMMGGHGGHRGGGGGGHHGGYGGGSGPYRGAGAGGGGHRGGYGGGGGGYGRGGGGGYQGGGAWGAGPGPQGLIYKWLNPSYLTLAEKDYIASS